MPYQKSAIYYKPGIIKIVKQKIPIIDNNSILLKIMSCTICGSDIKIYKNGSKRISSPRILGHEISGIVFKKGKDVNKFNIGDRLSLGADISKKIDFAFGYEIDGGLTQYLSISSQILKHGPIQKFDKKINYDLAALAEPLACCLNGYEKSGVKKHKTIVIFGAGPIGIILALVGKYYKAKKIIFVEKSKIREKFVKKNLKFIDSIFNPNIHNIKSEIMKKTNNLGTDYIFTANSEVSTQTQSLKIIKKGGVINLFGGLPDGSKNIILPSNLVHYNELSIVGSHGSSITQHKKAIKLIESKKIKLDKLITHKYKLSQIHKAFDTAISGRAIKIVINPNA